MHTTAASSMGGIVFAFDHGAARTGVAIAETITGSVRPLICLSCKSGTPNWQQLDQLLKEWQPKHLIVGLPLALDGSRTPTTRAARRFAASLQERYQIPVELHDERLTSKEAESRFVKARQQGQTRRRQHQLLDAMAACVILESWLAQQPELDRPPAKTDIN